MPLSVQYVMLKLDKTYLKYVEDIIQNQDGPPLGEVILRGASGTKNLV